MLDPTSSPQAMWYRRRSPPTRQMSIISTGNGANLLRHTLEPDAMLPISVCPHAVPVVRRGTLVFEAYFSGNDEHWGQVVGEVAFGQRPSMTSAP